EDGTEGVRIGAQQNERNRRTLLEQGPVGPPHERWFLEEGMTHRTHAVAKTRAHQVRWSSRCRSRTTGAGAGAGARGAAAAGRGRTTQLRLSSASTLVDGSPQLQRSSHALLRPQEVWMKNQFELNKH
ncbi:hypothetical protein X777_01127, partial [Ooceraea biroi]